MQYREELLDAKCHKENYLAGLQAVLRQREQAYNAVRAQRAERIFRDPESARREYLEMLGWPLTEPRPALPPEPTCETLSEEDGYTIYRMHFPVLEGLTMSGLFFRQHGDEKRPLVITQHGGAGTPELMSGMHGYTGNYNELVARVLQHGVHAFMPQLLLWSKEPCGVDYDRLELDASLKRVGSSITAVEVYGITRILDYFEAQPYVGKFGMVGLSYGGFYTLFTAAAEPRIQSAISSGFFNQRERYPWPDFTWQNSAEKFDDAEIACLVYPRRIHLQLGKSDPLFAEQGALDSFEQLKAYTKTVGRDWVDLTADVRVSAHPGYTKPGPVLHVREIARCQAPREEVATFY